MSRRTILGLSLWMIAALCQTIAVEAATGISGVTHGAADLKAVPNTPTGQSWYYGIGMPLQLDATTAGVLTNIRRNLTPYGDFEVGNDMVMFNSLGGVNTSRLVPISRPTYENNPDTGVPSITAGTAQRVTQWPVGGTGWEIISPGLSAAIPDGNDLLMPVTCAGFSADSVAGVARFQHGPNGWQPTSFAPITERAATWFEPSLVRDTDGSLLFTARDNHVNGTGNIPLWQSSNGGQAWNQLFFLEDARTGTTLTLNQALDGTPYFMTNTEIGTDRNILEIVPLDAARDGLLSPILARNASADFGPAPSGHGWKVDHGIGAVARLADGQWHGIATYRVLDQGENSGHSATPYTGLYVEEAFSVGDPRPMGFIFAPEPSTLVLTLLAAAGILGYLCARRRA